MLDWPLYMLLSQCCTVPHRMCANRSHVYYRLASKHTTHPYRDEHLFNPEMTCCSSADLIRDCRQARQHCKLHIANYQDTFSKFSQCLGIQHSPWRFFKEALPITWSASSNQEQCYPAQTTHQ